MPDNGNYQLQTRETPPVRICEIVSASASLERAKITNNLYGGGWLMQTVGTPQRVYTLKIRAWTREEQAAVNDANAACAVIEAKLGAKTVVGAILDAPSWSIIVDSGIFEATVKFAEVTA